MTFLTKEQNAAFAGTGERNAQGKDLETFLEDYDPKRYDSPCNTVDTAIFLSDGPYMSGKDPLKLLMIRRGNHPNIGYWALPGGFVEIRENLRDAAARELMEETGVTGVGLTQLRTWGDYDRDPRWRVITTAFAALLENPAQIKAGDDAADALWFDVSAEEEIPGADVIRAAETEGLADAAVYTLKLRNDERDLTLMCHAWRGFTGSGLLRDVRWHQLGNSMIAGDHGLVILDALLYLYGLVK